MSRLVKILGVVIGLFFVFAGGSKLAGMSPHPEHFAQWGYPDWFRLFVGAWETVFGISFMIPSLATVAGGALMLGMVGAIFTAATRGPQPVQALFPLVILGLVAFVTRARRNA